MAKPQKENGFTQIPNKIMDALVKIRISGEARQVLDAIIRKTYGWRKPNDEISLSQFEEMTGLARPSICRAINKLLKMNIIVKKGNAKSLFSKKGNDFTSIYSIQKNHEAWHILTKMLTWINKNANVKHVNKNVNLTLTKMLPTKESIKEREYTHYLSGQFKNFYDSYPKKKAKVDAQKAWSQLWNGTSSKYHVGKLNDETMKKILGAIKNQSNSPEWQEDGGRYIPHPATWLRGHRWNDQIQESKEQKGVVL